MRIIDLPNALTVARIIIIPVFVTAIIYKKHPHAFFLFVLAALTDLLDGYIARVTDQKTALGTFLDPLADKLLLTSSFILFSFNAWIPLWLTITVISRDIIVVIGWLLLYMITHEVDILDVPNIRQDVRSEPKIIHLHGMMQATKHHFTNLSAVNWSWYSWRRC